MTGTLRIRGGCDWKTGAEIDLAIVEGIIAVDDPGDGEVIDATGLTVAPGLIDTQINGAFGRDLTASPEAVWEIATGLPQHGVTAFLPTLVSPDASTVRAAIEVLDGGPPPGWRGAMPLGLHLEGPFLAPGRRGAHPAGALVQPSPATVDTWGDLRHVRMVTIAPELEGAEPVISHLARSGVVVALGHSDADYDRAVAAIGWGARHGTHLFNAMSGVDHRTPGLAAALLADGRVTCGLIVDGVHVHPGAVRVAYRAKGIAGLALVTDAMAGMGEGDGRYPLGESVVEVREGRATTGEGRLAGSVLRLDEAVRNFVAYTGCEPWEALAAAGATPAGVVGDAGRGGLSPGMRGDVTLLDADLVPRATIVAGALVHTDGVS